MTVPSIKTLRRGSAIDPGPLPGITFTRAVVETVEVGDEPMPPSRRSDFPYIESYQEAPIRTSHS